MAKFINRRNGKNLLPIDQAIRVFLLAVVFVYRQERYGFMWWMNTGDPGGAPDLTGTGSQPSPPGV